MNPHDIRMTPDEAIVVLHNVFVPLEDNKEKVVAREALTTLATAYTNSLEVIDALSARLLQLGKGFCTPDGVHYHPTEDGNWVQS